LSYCRTVGKTSSEIRFYFPAPDVQFVSDLSSNVVGCRGDGNMNCVINKRASYISGQTIYGDAILANVGYTRRDTELQTENVTLCTYYRYQLVHCFTDADVFAARMYSESVIQQLKVCRELSSSCRYRSFALLISVVILIVIFWDCFSLLFDRD
jgi:hypothetical protein